jgi:hypothetical protein
MSQVENPIMVAAEGDEGLGRSEETEQVEESGDEVEVTYSAHQVLKKVPSSMVWPFFYFKQNKTTKLANMSRVYCRVCPSGNKSLKEGLPYCNSTSNLSNHLKVHHPKAFKDAEDDKNAPTDLNQNQVKINKIFTPKTVVKWKKNSEKWKKVTMSITKWFVQDTRPAYMVEDEGFIKFMAIACPEYETPCANTISKYIDELYIQESERVKNELKDFEFLAMTTDGGSSSNARSFQEMGVHGITENFDMKYYTLGVREVKESHTAANYRKNTDKVLEEFDVKDKVVLTTTDNENKMRAAYKDDERNGCLQHITHSSLSSGLTKEKSINSIVLKQRRIIAKHNKSYVVKYGLEEAQKQLGIKKKQLIQDVVNRWGSTRASTSSILDDEKDKKNVPASAVFGEELEGFMNTKAINMALKKHKFKKKEKLKEYLLTNTDMKKILHLNSFLKTFDLYSTTLGGNKFVTSSIVMPMMKSIQKHLSSWDDDPSYIIIMKKIVLDEFKERTELNLNFDFLIKATALDPRFLKLKVLSDKTARDRVFERLGVEAREYLEKEEDVQKVRLMEPLVKKRKMGLDWSESDSGESDEEDEDVIKQEIKSYRAESEISREEEDILSWWRDRKAKYPNLARLARKYLCVTATSTQAERVFSALGWLLNKRRLLLTGSHVNNQMFLKENLEN